MNLKDEKMAGIIKEIAADYINREANKSALITVTRAEILNRGKRATIFFTVLPEQEQDKSLEFLKRKTSDFRLFLSNKKVVGFAPQIRFEIDFGERNRQRIDELANTL